MRYQCQTHHPYIRLKTPIKKPVLIETSMKTLFIIASLFILTAFMPQSEIQTLPSIVIQNLDGDEVNTNSFDNDGKPMVVYFWTTWASPSKRELGQIDELYESWVEETGVKIIAISTDNSRTLPKVKPYVMSRDWLYETYVDPNSDFARAMKVINPPHLFLLDGNKEIVWTRNGYVPGDEEELWNRIKEL